MATRLLHTMVYDAPAAAVAEMLSSAAFREEVCTNQKATGHKVTLEGDVNAKQVRVEMTQPTDRIPAFAKKIVGTEVTIVQDETWSSPTKGDLHVTIPGKPGEMRGTVTLVEVDGVTTETVDLQVTVKIPIVGGKVEELLAKLLGSAMRSEERTAKAWLAR